MNQKCPSCGLVNWSDALECKRCKGPLQQLGEGDVFQSTMPVVEQEKPATVLGVLMIIWGILTLTAGVYLLTLGAVNHALVFGPAIIVSGISVKRGTQGAMTLYFLGVVVMLFWILAQGKIALGIGSFLFAGLIGLLVAKRRVPVLAGTLIVFSSLAMIVAIVVPTLMRPARVAWRSFQPPEGRLTVQMPSEPIKRETRVEQIGGLTLTKHRYDSMVRGQGAAVYIVVEFSPALPLSATSSYGKFLDAELTNLLSSTNSTLVSKQEVALPGYQGLMYEAKPPSNLDLEKPLSVGRIFLSADRLYLMHLTASESSELMFYSAEFLNPVPSFQSAAPQAQR